MTKLIVAVHQPNYIPWIGYFYKIMKSDIFVLYDDVQYTKNSYINRNKIKTPQGDCWLTLPVFIKGNFGCNINETQLKNELNWKEKHVKTIEMNYKKAPYFVRYFSGLKEVYEQNYEIISDLNIELIKYFMKSIGIETKLIKSSELDVDGSSTQKLVNICKAVGGDTYLSGKGGDNYQDQSLYEQNDIKLVYTDFIHPEYKQLWGDFLPYMSVMDFLFNCGDECMDILKSRSRQ